MTHATLGLDGTEVVAKSKYNTYCNLCRRLINKGEQAFTWPGSKFLIHLDCNTLEVKSREGVWDKQKSKKGSKKRKSVKAVHRNRHNWY